MSSCAGNIFALAAESGDVVWSYDVTSDGAARSFTGRMLRRDTTVFVAPHGDGAHVYAFDVGTGDLRWKAAAGTGVATDLVDSGSALYAVTLEDELLCLDLHSGSLRWSYAAGPVPADARTLGSTPAVFEERVFFAALNGTIRALDARDGGVLWRRDLGHEVTTSVLHDGDALIVGLSDSTLVRIDAATGKALGRVRLPSHAGGVLVSHGERIVAMLAPSSSTSEIAVVDGSLRLLWHGQAPKGYWTTPRPTLFAGRIWLGTSEGTVHAYDVESGAHVTSISVDAEHEWDLDNVRVLGVDENGIYVGTIGGVLFALEPRP